MTNSPSSRTPAPTATGDIVPGDPPVPISTWYVPIAPPGTIMSAPLAERLIINFAHRYTRILDLTEDNTMACAAAATQRWHHHHTLDDPTRGQQKAALIVSGWPLGRTTAPTLLANSARLLIPGGCIAIMVTTEDITVHHTLISAARAAGLTYLQHIVAMHPLPVPAPTHHEPPSPDEDKTRPHIHTDILVFYQPTGSGHG